MWPFSRRNKAPHPQGVPAPARPPRQPVSAGGRQFAVQPPSPREARLKLVPLSDDGRLAVVGESHYQDALRQVAGGRAFGTDFEEHLPATAVLVPEPENPWDRNAVRVDALMGNRPLKVGYLSSTWAEDYQPELLKLRAAGVLGTCPARITGGGAKSYGIYLHVAGPDELHSRKEPEDPVVAKLTASDVLLRNAWSCTVTKEENHQDVLRDFAPTGKQEYREVVASLTFCTIESGKYQGRRAIEVRLGDHRVGQLTYAMTERYRSMVERFSEQNLIVRCEAYTTRTAKGVEVELLMPRDPRRAAL
ncbi:HIRAN domain-containing protein [Amycolatopsis sp. NPDC005961]|uniref:HIRAN domain-containing protein n=1 Tax=Amycolatopsis sp. NPDC005961 TaxID=3156720 RepID=UPI0033D93598